MVRRRADEGQPQGDVDAAREIDGLERDQGLVVIHAQRGVIARARGGVEQAVGRRRAGDRDALGLQCRDRGRDDLGLLAAERAALPGVRIEPGHRQARRRDAEIGGQRRRGHAPGVNDRLGGERAGRLGQRQVNGDRHHPQARAGQHHDRRRVDPGQGREIFGMARIPESGPVEGFLLDRVGDHGGRLAGLDQRHGALDRRDHGRGVGRVGPARFHVGRQFLGQHRQGPGKHRLGLGRPGDGDDRNLEAEPFGQGAQARRIVDREEAAGRRPPGRERELAADAGRFAHGQRERPQGSRRPALDLWVHCLMSTLALRRRSRM